MSTAQVPGYSGLVPKRTLLGFFLGACEFEGWSYGKRMRAWFVTEAKKLNAPDLVVGCSTGQRRVRVCSSFHL